MRPGVYWVNAPPNDMVGQAVGPAGETTPSGVYDLLGPGRCVLASLNNLDVVFPDVELRENVLWSMLYLTGCLTSDVTESHGDDLSRRPFGIPNQEIRHLWQGLVSD